jgi:hypothetical protein
MTLVGGGGRPVLLKLDNWLKTEGSGSDFWLKDPNKVGSGSFCEVDDDQLWGNGSVYLLTNLFGKGRAGKMLF